MSSWNMMEKTCHPDRLWWTTFLGQNFVPHPINNFRRVKNLWNLYETVKLNYGGELELFTQHQMSGLVISTVAYSFSNRLNGGRYFSSVRIKEWDRNSCIGTFISEKVIYSFSRRRTGNLQNDWGYYKNVMLPSPSKIIRNF